MMLQQYAPAAALLAAILFTPAALAQVEPAETVEPAEAVEAAEGATPGKTVEPTPPKSGCCGRCGKGNAAAHGRAQGQGQGQGQGYGHGQGKGAGAGAGHGPGPHAGMGCGAGAGADHHDMIHSLLGDHEKIRREVESIDGGIVSETTSEDPEVTDWIRAHVAQMGERLEAGQGLRHWDPLFVEIFEHHDAIQMDVETIPGGVRVRETSDDPRVGMLIEKHAEAVSEFVEQGFERAHRETPLPQGYTCPLLVDEEDAEEDDDATSAAADDDAPKTTTAP